MKPTRPKCTFLKRFIAFGGCQGYDHKIGNEKEISVGYYSINALWQEKASNAKRVLLFVRINLQFRNVSLYSAQVKGFNLPTA